MTLFVVIAGVFLLAVMAAVLYPLVRGSGQEHDASAKLRELNLAVLREQRTELERERAEGVIDAAVYETAREELERRVLEDGVEAGAPSSGTSAIRRPLVIGIVGLLLPVTVISLYLYLGEPGAMTGGKPAAMASSGSHAVTPQQIAAMVESLAAKLQENPGDGEGWLMLARSYAAMGRYPESVTAYARAMDILPPDAQALADFADVLAMAQGRSLQGQPEMIVRRALQVDPNNVKALALSGTIFFDRQDYPAAIKEWQKILTLVPEGSGVATGIQSSIRDAENRMAMVAKKEASPAAPMLPGTGGVSGKVILDPALAAAIAPGDTLFVFARAVDGPKMPLAMLKKTVSDLPLQFALDDSMAMAPNFRLSQFRQVVIGARISKSGDAMPHPGDLEGLSAPVSLGATGVKITIDRKVN